MAARKTKIQRILENPDEWCLLFSNNSALNIKHEVILKVKKIRKISNRLYEVSGSYSNLMKSGYVILSHRLEENKDLIMMSELNLLEESVEPEFISPEKGEEIFTKHKAGWLSFEDENKISEEDVVKHNVELIKKTIDVVKSNKATDTTDTTGTINATNPLF